MADIRTYPFLSHLRSDPTSWVQHQHNGKVRHVGAGQSFWFRPRTAALAEVPLEDREQTVLFHARTADFQDVTVASTVTYRVEDPALAATRTDFGVSPRNGALERRPLETLGGLLSELAQQPAVELVAEITLADALAHGIGPIRERVGGGARRRPAAARARSARHRRARRVGAHRPRGRASTADRDP